MSDDDLPPAAQDLADDLGDDDPPAAAGPTPVLWVGLTSYGREVADDEHLDHVADRVREAVGDDYRVIAADDAVRLLDEDDIRDMLTTALEALDG